MVLENWIEWEERKTVGFELRCICSGELEVLEIGYERRTRERERVAWRGGGSWMYGRRCDSYATRVYHNKTEDLYHPSLSRLRERRPRSLNLSPIVPPKLGTLLHASSFLDPSITTTSFITPPNPTFNNHIIPPPHHCPADGASPLDYSATQYASAFS